MKLHRFYSRESVGELKEITIANPELLHQLKNVFRLHRDDAAILFDNSGYDFTASIKDFYDDSVTFSITEVVKNETYAAREVYLFASIVKKDTFEWIVEKATELGVTHIVPVMSARSEKKNLNLIRLEKIIIEASEQSGRGIVPTLHPILDLETVLTTYSTIPSIAWHTRAQKFSGNDLEGVTGSYIGPEGGWTDEEIELFKKNQVKVLSVGSQVLRSETAVIATLSQLVF